MCLEKNIFFDFIHEKTIDVSAHLTVHKTRFCLAINKNLHYRRTMSVRICDCDVSQVEKQNMY